MKKILFCIMLVSVLLLCASCGFEHIEDTNGNDTSLCTLTQEDLLAEASSYISFGSMETRINDNYSYSVKKLSGVYRLIRFPAEGSSLTIETSAVLTQGNLRIVLLCDGEYVADIPLAENQSITIDDPSGTYSIVLGAESAELKFTYSYSVQ